GVAQKLVTPEAKAAFVAERRDEYQAERDRNAKGKAKALLSYDAACTNAFRPDFSNYKPVKPNKLGVTVDEAFELAELAEYIDWAPFFVSWELAGKCPRILEDDVVGEAATPLFKDAQAVLARIIHEELFAARGVVGLWPAQRRGEDDIVVF